MTFSLPFMRFMRHSKLGLIFSAVFTAACLALIFIRGFNFGLEFTGGSTIELQYQQAADIDEIRAQISALHPNATVVQYGTSKDVQIRFAELEGMSSDVLMQKMVETLQAHSPDVQLLSQSRIDGQYKTELVEKGILALVLASLGMMVYLGLRFEWKFALGAVLAQIHDVIVTAALFALTQWTFDLTVLAALLAVLGYSVNDTVVVFDRIRENFRNSAVDTDAGQAIDEAINQTLARTIVTSLTTLLACITLLFFGGATLFGFAAAMTFGVIFGSYSSIFVASAMVHQMGVSPLDLLPKAKKIVDELP